MVSTRGYRHNNIFSEGERVLCYEPDPTKVKVLYDSKVVEVIESKDKRGRRRRSVEYLIHFQGWNSSWDRRVKEGFVLKDTEENRQLQRELAERSQLQLGAYLYRKERKHGGSMSVGSGAAKRARLSDDGSQEGPPTLPAIGAPNVERLDKIDTTDTSSGDVEVEDDQTLPAASCPRATITLPQDLRDRLTFDYHLVVKRGRLLRLPANPCAAEILESFVKWFARAGAWHPPRGRNDPPPPQKPNLLDVSSRLNLVREVADGLRMYFDFVLRGHLLYTRELPQYELHCGNDRFNKTIKEDEPMDPALAEAVEALKSPKLPEYAHLPPDPATLLQVKSEEPKHTVTQAAGVVEESVKSDPGGVKNEASAKVETLNDPVPPPPPPPPPPARPPLARRLRSHKSAVSHPEDEPTPSTSLDLPSSSVCSSSSSRSEGVPRPLPVATPTRTPLSLLLDKVANWKIIPHEGTEHLPCRVYGAVHLTRLFLKLPEFLRAANMPDFKLKLILKHVDMFVQYVHEHPEWFGDIKYEPSPPPKPH